MEKIIGILFIISGLIFIGLLIYWESKMKDVRSISFYIKKCKSYFKVIRIERRLQYNIFGKKIGYSYSEYYQGETIITDPCWDEYLGPSYKIKHYQFKTLKEANKYIDKMSHN